MTKEEIKQILEEQLALDYDCSVEEIQSSNNIFRTWKRNEGARYIGDDDCMLKIAVSAKLSQRRHIHSGR